MLPGWLPFIRHYIEMVLFVLSATVSLIAAVAFRLSCTVCRANHVTTPVSTTNTPVRTSSRLFTSPAFTDPSLAGVHTLGERSLMSRVGL